MSPAVKNRLYTVILFVAVAMMGSISSGFSQGINFELVYGTKNYDDAKGVIQTYDSGYVVVGSTSGFGHGLSDLYLTKISKQGNVGWQQTFGGAGVDKGNTVISTPDSGFVIAGFTNSFHNNNYEVYVVRADRNGNEVWSKTYGGKDWSFGNSIIRTTKGDLIIAGSTFANGNEDMYLLKTDFAGNKLWEHIYGGDSADAANSVVEAPDGGYLLTGYTKSFGKGNKDIYIVKTDKDGNLLWSKTYGGKNEDSGNQAIATLDSSYVIAGYSKNFFGGKYLTYWIFKINSLGDTLNQWKVTDNTQRDQYANSICRTFDGGYTVTGGMGNTPDYFLMKLNSGGGWQNTRSYGGADKDIAYAVKQTYDSGYVAVGITYSYGDGVPNIYVLKTGPNLASTGNILVVVGIDELSDRNKPVMIYPNPAFSHVNIAISKQSVVEIFDAMGRELLHAQVIQGNNTVDISFIPDGIYFIRIINDDQLFLDKIIIRH